MSALCNFPKNRFDFPERVGVGSVDNGLRGSWMWRKTLVGGDACHAIFVLFVWWGTLASSPWTGESWWQFGERTIFDTNLECGTGTNWGIEKVKSDFRGRRNWVNFSYWRRRSGSSDEGWEGGKTGGWMEENTGWGKRKDLLDCFLSF